MHERLFGTDGLRGRVNHFPLTADTVLRLGLAAGTLFRDGLHRHKVIIGKDTRLSGYVFESALTAGLCATGMDVFQVGPLPTPAIAFLTRNMRADLGIVISASHNPFHDNGIKFFDRGGFKLPDEAEDRMAEMVLAQNHEWQYPPADKVGRAHKIVDAPSRYIVYLKNSFPQNLTLAGLRVVIDCANGANYKVAPLALEELGAEVFPLGTDPDGLNINLRCGSLHPEAMRDKVLAVRADMGISLDGDADRLVVADEKGRILDGDQLMALCADDMMSQGRLSGNRLVSTVMSNMALQVFMEERGGTLLRTAVGDRYVVEAMRECDAALGGEQSGHLIFREYSTTGDGLLAALQILRIMRERALPLSALADQLVLWPQVVLSVSIGRKLPFEDCAALAQARREAETGLGKDGRVLLRYSGTENLCRIMVEGRDGEQVQRIARHLADIAEKNLR
jgi:phosphoglucosamine mutase